MGKPMISHKKIALPLGLGLSKSGKVEWRSNGHVVVQKAGKAPKRRFEPGNFVWMENQLWEIMYAFLLAENRSEWLYCFEERGSFRSIRPGNRIGQAFEAMGAGSKTPRVVYEAFRSEFDASCFFTDIPANGNRKTFSNKQLLKGKAEIRSSGEILEPEV